MSETALNDFLEWSRKTHLSPSARLTALHDADMESRLAAANKIIADQSAIIAEARAGFQAIVATGRTFQRPTKRIAAMLAIAGIAMAKLEGRTR